MHRKPSILRASPDQPWRVLLGNKRAGDATAATTLGSRSLGQLVQQGPLVINGQTLVVGYDGSLYQIDTSSL